jgi:hypothetical protein
VFRAQPTQRNIGRHCPCGTAGTSIAHQRVSPPQRNLTARGKKNLECASIRGFCLAVVVIGEESLFFPEFLATCSRESH